MSLLPKITATTDEKKKNQKNINQVSQTIINTNNNDLRS